MARKRARSPTFLQSAEAAALVKDTEQPAAMRAALRLVYKGGRPKVRRCRACGKKGTVARVWVPDTVRQVMSGGTGIEVYWLCARCHGRLPEGPPP